MTVPAADIVDRLGQEHWKCGCGQPNKGICGQAMPLACDRCDTELLAADEIVRLRNQLDAIAALHHTDEYENWCRGCDRLWPCPTARLLHPPVPAEETLPNTQVQP
jgi:hypothetical protein